MRMKFYMHPLKACDKKRKQTKTSTTSMQARLGSPLFNGQTLETFAVATHGSENEF